MTLNEIKDFLERNQIAIYIISALAAALTVLFANFAAPESAVNPVLAIMMFATFLQVPLSDLGRVFSQGRFIAALLVANFLVIPGLVSVLLILIPVSPLTQLGVLFVLLTPCIDYVVTFSHQGKADSRLLLAATPLLLILQILLLPIGLKIFLGSQAASSVAIEPFLHAFIWLIAVPLLLAGLVQFLMRKTTWGSRVGNALGALPVPSTALVLIVIIGAFGAQIGLAKEAVTEALPVFVVFALVAPLIGWICAKLLNLEIKMTRAIMFSAATRNSLVVLPLALAIPGAVPVLPAVIITQTFVELLSEIAYIRTIPWLSNILSTPLSRRSQK